MGWTLLGYFPKRLARRESWVSPHPDHPEAGFPTGPPVEEICSVSHCIARGPEGSEAVEGSNAFGGFASPSAAWDAVAPGEQKSFAVYAYRLGSAVFADGERVEREDVALDPDPVALPEPFERLGYDAVELAHGVSLGCSPLSCNGQAAGEPVNRHCLMETEAQGIELARRFSLSKPEAGPYAVVEVWRARPGWSD